MSAGEIANIYSSINNIQLGLNEVTGNTFSNYNQLSRIVAQQANIYNSVYYGSGNIVTGNIVINNNANINGILNIDNGLLYSNPTNNRIGINNTNPQYELDVKGSANITENASLNTFSLSSSNYFTSPTKILAGTITIPSTASNSGYSVAVTFSVPFSSRPIVVYNADNVNLLSSVFSVSTTGFTATGRNVAGSATGGTGNWIAIGPA